MIKDHRLRLGGLSILGVMLLVAMLLMLAIPQSASASNILWFEHTISGDFNAAASVYATDVDGDGDIDVLGAAYIADDITWWENDGNQSFAERFRRRLDLRLLITH